MSEADAIVVGAGPNGLAAAVTLADAGWSVEVREAAETVGGGARTDELTLPGFRHDLCSAVHPMAALSPFFHALDVAAYGVEWVHAPLPLAHPLEGNRAAVLDRSVEATARALNDDAERYRALFDPLVARWREVAEEILQPIRLPRRPLLMARFGSQALRSADRLARTRFHCESARALFAGIAAHGILPLEQPATSAFALALALAGHAVGWPAARGGSQAIADALATRVRQLGGVIRTGEPVEAVDDLPPCRAVLLDLTPAQVVRIAGHRLPFRFRRSLINYRYGPGVFKLDWALSEPVPWRAEACRSAMTVHVGGRMEEIALAEREVATGKVPDRPFVLFAQPSVFDDSRAPAGRHTAWAYCHVPHGSAVDMTGAIEAQIERFAPGFHDIILARAAHGPGALEQRNPNLVGGDISGGAASLRQTIFRPTLRLDSYTTPLRGLYLCSSSTPPGAGVHGMCGFNAAKTVLRDFRVRRRRS